MPMLAGAEAMLLDDPRRLRSGLMRRRCWVDWRRCEIPGRAIHEKVAVVVVLSLMLESMLVSRLPLGRVPADAADEVNEAPPGIVGGNDDG